MGLECAAEVSDRKGNKVSGQSVRLTDGSKRKMHGTSED
jgi:hypothetical protein